MLTIQDAGLSTERKQELIAIMGVIRDLLSSEIKSDFMTINESIQVLNSLVSEFQSTPHRDIINKLNYQIGLDNIEEKKNTKRTINYI